MVEEKTNQAKGEEKEQPKKSRRPSSEEAVAPSPSHDDEVVDASVDQIDDAAKFEQLTGAASDSPIRQETEAAAVRTGISDHQIPPALGTASRGTAERLRVRIRHRH